MAKEMTAWRGVLIVEPRPNMAGLVATMLRAIGRNGNREANDAAQALAELDRRAFDLVIIDDALAGLDAVDLVRRLRTNAASPNRLTPVIMTAAAPDAARIQAARDAGVTEFLRKPFAASHLEARLESIRAAPRPFVEAETFAGPDRRRRTLAIGERNRRRSVD